MKKLADVALLTFYCQNTLVALLLINFLLVYSIDTILNLLTSSKVENLRDGRSAFLIFFITKCLMIETSNHDHNSTIECNINKLFLKVNKTLKMLLFEVRWKQKLLMLKLKRSFTRVLTKGKGLLGSCHTFHSNKRLFFRKCNQYIDAHK